MPATPPHSVTLRDPASGAEAEIMVSMGCNCHRLQLISNGQLVDMLWSAPGFAQQGGHPCGSGIPLLFPFPGRIRGGVTQWRNRRYGLPRGDAEGNAIHGFVIDRPWHIVTQSETRLVADFQVSRDVPQLLDSWPTDFCIQADYQLSAEQLGLVFRVFNPTAEPLPCGLGLHPYFRVPLGPNGSGEDCRIQLPVTKTWELDQLIATGRKLDLPNAASLQQGVPYAELKLDALFGDLQFQQDSSVATITDLRHKRRMVLRFWKPFREIVVYTPPDRQSICVEPWSCITDPLRLTEAGIDTGLSIIAPHQSVDFRAAIELQTVSSG